MPDCFVKLDNSIVLKSTIEFIDDSKINDLIIKVKHKHGEDTVTGFFAIELIYMLKPSALEGNWLHYKKHMWSIHNLFAHPLMQIFSYFRLYSLAIYIHDVTVPKPKSKNN